MRYPLLVIGLLLPSLGLSAPGRTVDIRVVDETGEPIKAAKVIVHAGKENDLSESGRMGFQSVTDAEGRWNHAFLPEWGLENIQIFVGEANDNQGHYGINLEKFVSFHEPRAAYNLTLPRVIHPTALKARWCGFDYQYEFEADGRLHPWSKAVPRTVGFDAEKVSWLAPFGIGQKADFFVEVTSKQTGWEISANELTWHRNQRDYSEEILAHRHGKWSSTLLISFPNPGDGIVRSDKFWPYCSMKMPHRAPLAGYHGKLALIQTNEDLGAAHTIKRLELPENCGYFLRVRTKLGADGEVISAHYVKMLRPKVRPSGFGATFFFNPTENDTNLEYSSNNLLWPRPEGESTFRRPPVPFGLDVDEH